LNARTPAAHQFVSQPLRTRFILPVLDAWLAEKPENQIALRWLGLLRADTALLAKALALLPTDAPVRRRLVDEFLGIVDFATHHLYESIFLGDLPFIWDALTKAREVLQAAPDASCFPDLKQEIEDFENLLRDWEEYQRTRQGSFPEWCAAQGRSYPWQRSYYYQ
jgi:hypothetical protein